MQEFSKRQGISERIEEHKAILERKNKTMKDKNEDFLKLKQKHEQELQELTGQKSFLQLKRLKMQEEVNIIQREIAEQDKGYQEKINDLSESLSNIKKKTVELEKNTGVLNEEYRILTKEFEKKTEEEVASKEAQVRNEEFKRKGTGNMKRNSYIANEKTNTVISNKKV